MTRKEFTSVIYLISELSVGIQELNNYARDYDCKDMKSIEERLTKAVNGFYKLINK